MGFTPKRYTTQTAIEALRQVAIEFEAMLTEEVLTKYPGQTLGQVIRDQYLLHLKRMILQSWRRRRTLTTEVLQELPCYPEREPRFDAAGLVLTWVAIMAVSVILRPSYENESPSWKRSL